MTNEELLRLKAEFTANPACHDADGKLLGDVEIAEVLCRRDRKVDRETLYGGEIAAAVVKVDYMKLSAAERDYLQMLVSTSTAIQVTPTLRADLKDLFPKDSPTWKNLRQAIQRDGCRADELSLGHVTPSDVALARNLGG